MAKDKYAIKGGVKGRDRLRLLSRVFHASTLDLLDRIDIAPGATCLDLGCGGGDVAVEMAHRVGPEGRVIGIDSDPVAIELARAEAADLELTNVEYQERDITGPLDVGSVDVVHMRFLLSHLHHVTDLLERVFSILKPGGAIAVMDVDFRGHFSFPESAALDRFVSLYTEVVRRRGGDANIGPRLPLLVGGAGFQDVEMELVHLADIKGDTKLLTPVTMQLIAEAVAEGGLAEEDELLDVIETLYRQARDLEYVMGLPRVFQVWARKPG